MTQRRYLGSRRRLLSVFLLAFCSFAAAADEASIDKRASIRALLNITVLNGIEERLVDSIIKQQRIRSADEIIDFHPEEKAKESHPVTLPLSESRPGTLEELVQLLVSRSLEQLIESNIDIYDENFSATEIAEMLRFYSSDTGKKMMSVRSNVFGEIRQAELAWRASRYDEIEAYLEDIQSGN